MKCLRVLTEKEMLGVNDYPKSWRSARGIVLDEENRIGMLYVKISDRYELPGGEIDNNESIEDAFIREIKEEMGCDCVIIKELGYAEQNHAKNNTVWISYYFLARIAGAKGKPNYTEEETEKTITAEWHTPNDAIRLIEHNKADSWSSIFLKESSLAALRKCFN